MPDIDIVEEANGLWTGENDSTQKDIKEFSNVGSLAAAECVNKCENYPDVITPRDDSLESPSSSKDQWEMNMEDGSIDYREEVQFEEKCSITEEKLANVDSTCSCKRSPRYGSIEHELIEYDAALDLNQSRTGNLNSSNLGVYEAVARSESADTVCSVFPMVSKMVEGKGKPSNDGDRFLDRSFCRNQNLKSLHSSEYDACPLSAATNLIHDVDFLRNKASNGSMSMPAIVPPMDVRKSSSKRTSELEKPLLQNRYLTTIGDSRQSSSVNAGGSSTRRKLSWICCI